MRVLVKDCMVGAIAGHKCVRETYHETAEKTLPPGGVEIGSDLYPTYMI
jgi:hypothetical protein